MKFIVVFLSASNIAMSVVFYGFYSHMLCALAHVLILCSFFLFHCQCTSA